MIKNRLISFVILLVSMLIIHTTVSAQSDVAVQFLLISPSPSVNGMGNNFMAISERDAMSPIYNPGNLGIFALENRLSLSFYSQKVSWLPQKKWDIFYDCQAINVSFKLPFHLKAGVGYNRIYLNLGTYFDRPLEEDYPSTQSWEKAEALSFGVGIDHKIKAGIGISLKHIYSKLAGWGASIYSAGDEALNIFDPTRLKFVNSYEVGTQLFEADVNLVDIGAVFEFPLLKILNKPVQFSLGKKYIISPFFDTKIAYSMNNIGDKIKYIRSRGPEPLPRLVRLGYSFDTGFNLQQFSNLRVISFKWALGVEDLLAKERAYYYSKISYQFGLGLGNIDLYDLILGRSNSEVTQMKGWEISWLETFYLRHGRYNNPEREFSYKTIGYDFGLNGLFKVCLSFFPQNRALNYLLQHVEIQYNWSEINIEADHPLSGTKFTGFNFIIK